MTSKLSELELILTQINCSVIALTETWVTDDLAPTINIEGYKFIHEARSSWIRGVGF